MGQDTFGINLTGTVNAVLTVLNKENKGCGDWLCEGQEELWVQIEYTHGLACVQL